jgi:hypothetical protein
MERQYFMKVLFLILVFAQITFAQDALSRYEVEMLKNPKKAGKDTREVNAVLVFENDSLKVISRRKKQVFKEFRYADIKYIEHSFSKTPFMTSATKMTIITLMTGFPLFYSPEEKHWLTILGESDFAVMKVENDNYRLLKMEFALRKFDVIHINENLE